MRECDKADNKRLLLHSESDIMNELLKLKSEVANLTSDNNALRTQVNALQTKVNHLEQSDVASVQSRMVKLEQSLSNALYDIGNLTQGNNIKDNLIIKVIRGTIRSYKINALCVCQ